MKSTFEVNTEKDLNIHISKILVCFDLLTLVCLVCFGLLNLHFMSNVV